jgi:uncharacterized membrane protein YphA (DoxX/SURF4 family)
MSESANIKRSPRISALQSIILTILRLVVGWHLLYEGLTKLLATDWTAAGYLSRSNWILAPFFQWMTEDPARMRVVDLLNVWGLILIGLALLSGFLPRLASFFGAVLLLLYYAAFSPWYGAPAEDYYFVVSKVLIEAVALMILMVFPAGSMFRLDHLLAGMFRRGAVDGSVPATGPAGDVPQDAASQSVGRRELIGGLASLPLVGLFFGGFYHRWRSDRAGSDAITGATIKMPEVNLDKLKAQVPCGQIGNLKISRLMLGSNLIGGWSHSRDLIYVSSLFKAYNHEQKVMETLDLAERAGINMINCVNPQLELIAKYNRITRGKMQTQCQIRQLEGDLKREIDLAIDRGATTMYIQGAQGDRLVAQEKYDQLVEAIEHGRSQGYLVGMGAHSVRVPIVCEERGIDSDYYVKTFHHDRYWSAIPRNQRSEFTVDGERHLDHDKFHDNIFDLFPEQTVEVMAKVEKPFVAFKVLAAGAIAPQDGFRWAFENGADFICVGMFDFQIVPDANITLDTLKAVADAGTRRRPWFT